MEHSYAINKNKIVNNNNNNNSKSRNTDQRIVLLFDLDCFYAQCERVRLGLDVGISLALLQWDSVLAVTYPARNYGIKRGDSWDEVSKKSNGECWAVHLHILPKIQEQKHQQHKQKHQQQQTEEKEEYLVQHQPTTQNQQQLSQQTVPKENEQEQVPVLSSRDTLPAKGTVTGYDIAAKRGIEAEGEVEEIETIEENNNENANVEEAYDRLYKLSKEEQINCQQSERGLRRYHHEGKACLERYRLASQRIFQVVLDSLLQRLTNAKQRDSQKQNNHLFILERASIDEFYLDISTYCWNDDYHHVINKNDMDDVAEDKTVIVGREGIPNTGSNLLLPSVSSRSYAGQQPTSLAVALERACNVANLIRKDVWDTLGFTMSAGISTNKMMAKLAASYGKPNGQAVLHPDFFYTVMDQTKMRKVRNFGGKLGKQIELLLASERLVHTTNDITMGVVRQKLSIPVLQHHLKSIQLAQLVYNASRGIDNEPVKQTTGALVKSITAFKSFSPISIIINSTNNDRAIINDHDYHHQKASSSSMVESVSPELKNWLVLLIKEIVSRVNIDSVRNRRYPKSCTLNYTCYTSGTTTRPDGSQRKNRLSRSIRLNYPNEKHPNKVKIEQLLHQAIQKLTHLYHNKICSSVRGVGLSASNFESRGQPPDGVASIQNYFNKPKPLNHETKAKTEIAESRNLKGAITTETAKSAKCSNTSRIQLLPIMEHKAINNEMQQKNITPLNGKRKKTTQIQHCDHHHSQQQSQQHQEELQQKQIEQEGRHANRLQQYPEQINTPETRNISTRGSPFSKFTTNVQKQERCHEHHEEGLSESAGSIFGFPNAETIQNERIIYDPTSQSKSLSPTERTFFFDSAATKKSNSMKKFTSKRRRDANLSSLLLSNVAREGCRSMGDNNKSYQPCNAGRQISTSASPMPMKPFTGNETGEGNVTMGDASCSNTACTSVLDKDLELAKKLQASFDREDYVLSSIQPRHNKRRTNSSKVRRIDTFFRSGSNGKK